MKSKIKKVVYIFSIKIFAYFSGNKTFLKKLLIFWEKELSRLKLKKLFIFQGEL